MSPLAAPDTLPAPAAPPQISADPLRVHVDHLRDESYTSDDILKVCVCDVCCGLWWVAVGCWLLEGWVAFG